jgi:hypothetical protein
LSRRRRRRITEFGEECVSEFEFVVEFECHEWI